MRISVVLILLHVLAVPALAGHAHPEAWYQASWCAAMNGRAELVLDDGTRVDCVTPTHAVEVDFGCKWAEAIGQALHYAALTGLRPGVLLVLERGPEDLRYADRLRATCAAWGLAVDLWLVDGEGREVDGVLMAPIQ